jgi:hypothetical protein
VFLCHVCFFDECTVAPSNCHNIICCTSSNRSICKCYGFWLMVFNATFNNISVISWQSVFSWVAGIGNQGNDMIDGRWLDGESSTHFV